MTTRDPRDAQRDELRRIVRAVRAASGPLPGDDAAQRIADGAWERAGAGRRARAARRPRLRPIVRRLAIAAAAVLAVGIGVFALRPTEPVFAVEGEPVQVWKNGRWQEAHDVRPGTTVFVSAAGPVLRGRGRLAGDAIVPDPGTTFRIVTAGGSGVLTVQILGGSAEVRGGSLRLSLADVEVAPRGGTATLQAWGSLPATEHDGAPPPAAATAVRDALARVRIGVGDARLLRRSTGESLDLEGHEMAALLPVPGAEAGRTVYRLSRLRRFEPTLGVHIAAGHPVLDVRESSDGAIAVLGGPDDALTGVAIDRSDLPAALDQIRVAMLAFVSETPSTDENGGLHRTIVLRAAPEAGDPLEVRALASRQTLTEVRVTRDGSDVRVLLRGDGGVEVERDGEFREFDSLDAARTADPAAIELLGDYADR